VIVPGILRSAVIAVQTLVAVLAFAPLSALADFTGRVLDHASLHCSKALAGK
jgi:hypothetical protein